MTATHKSLLVALLAALLACTPGPGAGIDQQSSGSAQDPEPTNRIDIPPTVRRNLGITFAKVEVRHVAQTIRVPGAFELQPLARHEYRMALPGRVQMLVDQYDRVEADQPLFRYQSPQWPELLHEIILGEQAMETARVQIVIGKAKLEEAARKLELVRGRIETLAQAEVKRADLEIDAAEIEASQPRLEAELLLARTQLSNAMRTREHALHRAATAAGIPEGELDVEVVIDGKRLPAYSTIDWIEVCAVKAGVVEMLSVTDGAFVEPPATILSVVDPQLVRFRALALQTDLNRLTDSAQARIVPPLSAGTSVEEGVDARMTIGLEAHPRERTLTLLATPRGHADWIRPGVAAFLEIVVESTGAPALAVPRSAVVQDGLMHVLFRRDPGDPNKAIRVEADLGTSDGRWVVLNSGVMGGDEVVLDGAYELKLATQQSGGIQEGGHFHADGAFHDDH